MEQKVVITIEGKRSLPGGEPEVIQSVAQGSLEDRGEDGVVLIYQEAQGSGLEGTQTTLRVEPGRVALERTGAVSSQMVFEEGREHPSTYLTPYGAFQMRIRTRRLRVDLGGQGCELTIYYDLELEGAEAGRNMLHIQARPDR